MTVIEDLAGIKDLQKRLRLITRVTTYVKQQNKRFELPTVRQLAKRYKMSQDKMLTLIEDADYLDYNVAIASGSRMADYDSVSDYTVEFCGERDD